MSAPQYVKPKVAEQILGVNRRTLQKWAESGAIQYIRPGGSGPWMYDVHSIRSSSSTANVRPESSQESLGTNGGEGTTDGSWPTDSQAAALQSIAARTGGGAGTQPAEAKEDLRSDYIYARVSTRKQSDDLKSQITTLQSRHPGSLVLSDCASGLNFKRKGLKTLLELAIKRRVRTVYIAHKDRLCRFAFDLVEHILKLHGAKIVVDAYDTDTTTSTAISPELELAEDVLAVITVFGARLYGKRSAGGRQRRRDATAALEASEEAEKGEGVGEGAGAGGARESGGTEAEGDHRPAEASD